ncbi:WYL domain-containing protein [Paraglaciecola aquimarina]|uniref:WYL domain-containing protein n=1 Tax=Paraglaciecola aquimarina TaxID=1235557 RepID=A0ABU3T0L4_9ALTE|nr:WYL domain-containing protein [Paraglaciecola aquimarina]MDU0355814.1 WYL domain-containing protein [Paraglaciecola aquimarina]
MIKDGKELHWQLIELIAYWQGKVNTTHLMDHFTISRKQAGDYIRAYQDQFPLHLEYCKSTKAFLPSDNFQYQYINGDVTQYLEWLSKSSTLSIHDTAKQATLTYTSLQLPSRQVTPKIMRGLVNAINQRRRIEVDYVSLSNPDVEGRIIQPHIFVKTGLRWHLRAFDEKHQAFRDFVLSRFRGEPELLDKATHNADQDKGWNTVVSVILTPDTRLSATQKSVLAQDYQMQNGQLVIKTRAALTQYLLQEMQVNFKSIDKSPEAQQLVLVNEGDIKNWLFSG